MNFVFLILKHSSWKNVLYFSYFLNDFSLSNDDDFCGIERYLLLFIVF